MLACRHLKLEVPGRVLCGELTLVLERGEMWAILGRNGCGKTTLVHALAGLDRAAGTVVQLDGDVLCAVTRKRRAREIGVLLQQEETGFRGSVLDYVLLGRFPHADSWNGFAAEDERLARCALAEMDLAPLAGRPYVTLSGGERQRARIAQLLAQDPQVFLLDEPLQHLDLRHQARVLARFERFAREEQRTVAMVLHDALWPGRYCTHALLIYADGVPVSGPSREVLTRANLERLYEAALAEVSYDGGSCFVPHV
jgi:iron complex transport system ATP-binding protein